MHMLSFAHFVFQEAAPVFFLCHLNAQRAFVKVFDFKSDAWLASDWVQESMSVYGGQTDRHNYQQDCEEQ